MPELTQEMVEKAHEAVSKALMRYDRAPFRRLLADFIGAAPTLENLRAFAERCPDRWAQGLSILAGLAGFERGVTLNVNHWNVDQMTDAALIARMKELTLAAAKAAHIDRPSTIEGEIVGSYVEVPTFGAEIAGAQKPAPTKSAAPAPAAANDPDVPESGV